MERIDQFNDRDDPTDDADSERALREGYRAMRSFREARPPPRQFNDEETIINNAPGVFVPPSSSSTSLTSNILTDSIEILKRIEKKLDKLLEMENITIIKEEN